MRNDTQTHKYLKTLPNSEPRWRDRGFTPLDCSSLRVTWCPPGKRYELMKGPGEPIQACVSRCLGKWETRHREQEWREAGPLLITTQMQQGFHKQGIWQKTSFLFQQENLSRSIKSSTYANKSPRKQEMKQTSYLSKTENQNYRI